MADPAALNNLSQEHEFFVGIDSDGCVFDSMGIKQRECFCPMTIAHFGLQPVAMAARQCKEFADLFSKTRGANRHKTIVRILTELLPSHPIVRETGFAVPRFPHYCRWVNDPDSLLSDAGLQQAIDAADAAESRAELEGVMHWSRRVNELIKEVVRDIPPIPRVRESLEMVRKSADLIICSQTPTEALVREWRDNDLDKYVKLIAGQELGTKGQHLKLATAGRYARDHILMIGDAPGDLKAAREAEALFYPINPGAEIPSWKRFLEEAFARFLAGSYAGDYEDRLIAEFDACLPEHPSW